MPSILIVEHTVNKMVYITNKSENESTIFLGEITVQEPILYGQTVWVSSFKSPFKPMTSRRTHQRRIAWEERLQETIAFTIKYKDIPSGKHTKNDGKSPFIAG
jgi:hypothetical protein